MKDVNSSTTTLTFTAPSLPDGVFSGTVVVMVTAVNRFGIGQASDPETAVINSTYVRMCVHILPYVYIFIERSKIPRHLHIYISVNYLCPNLKLLPQS